MAAAVLIAEGIGGILTGSLALLSAAAHVFMDFLPHRYELTSFAP
ncbi:MAG: hypothetical protein ABSC61_00370 [Anaerolineales bacterium]